MKPVNKHTTRTLRKHKLATAAAPLQMLTCYDYQTACLLNETTLDLVLVGDSVGNVILGYDTTVQVSLAEMITFSAAVKRGAKDKFVVADLPFGTYSTLAAGIKSANALFQKTQVESVKLEGAFPFELELIERLTQTGIPVMGHIGLTPQSVHEQGGYYIHGKDEDSADQLVKDAINLEQAGAFAIVLECVQAEVAQKITKSVGIPTIGIGSGRHTDGQVLVINDLLQMGPNKPPKFCDPIANLYEVRKQLINEYLTKQAMVYGRTLNN